MNEKIYALYKGDKFISVGTKKEIAKELNVSVTTLSFYHSPSALKRNKYKFNNNSKILVEIKDDTEEEGEEK